MQLATLSLALYITGEAVTAYRVWVSRIFTRLTVTGL